MSNNKKKAEQLGMPHGTAAGRLRKQILWGYIVKCSDNVCHQCGEFINNIDELSIEHIVPWLDSEDPIGLYFEQKNIAFSHLSCNVANTSQTRNKMTPDEKRLAKRESDKKYRKTSTHFKEWNREYQRNWKRKKRLDPNFKEIERKQQRQRYQRSRSVSG